MDSLSKCLSLPKNWPRNVKMAVLHVISLAHVAIVNARGLVVNSSNARTRLAGDLSGALDEISLLVEELRIKDARMSMIDPQRRPHYRPIERMAILELKAARGWSQSETARRFLVKPTTIASWLKRIDEPSASPLVQMPEPVNKFPNLVGYVVRRLKVLFPSMGRKRIAQTLARAGLHLSATTVGRMLKERDHSPNAPMTTEATIPKVRQANGVRTVTARRPNHVWHVDLTVAPTSGFWTPWFPLSLPQVWPFCWWIGCAVDHHSRLVLGFAVYKKQPTSAAVQTFLGRVAQKARSLPKYIVCDQGVQFTSIGFQAWCKRRKIQLRYGAVHRYGSISVIERFIRSLKDEWLRRVIIPFGIDAMRTDLSAYLSWFNEHRPHQFLDGRTPLEVYQNSTPANEVARFEPRPKWPAQERAALCDRLTLSVSHHQGRKHLPIIELKHAA